MFTFNKALKAINKRREFELTLAEAMILVSVSSLQGVNGVKLEDIRKHLCSFYRSYPLDFILRKLKRFASFGLVDHSGYYPALYFLTLQGAALLNELEGKCRTTRIDK